MLKVLGDKPAGARTNCNREQEGIPPCEFMPLYKVKGMAVIGRGQTMHLGAKVEHVLARPDRFGQREAPLSPDNRDKFVHSLNARFGSIG